MEIYTTSQARSQLFRLVEHACMAHDPVYIVGKKHKAVVLSEEDYRALLETLSITQVPGMTESILAASKEPIEECSDKIDWDHV